jgi:hypothetical protein
MRMNAAAITREAGAAVEGTAERPRVLCPSRGAAAIPPGRSGKPTEPLSF